MIRITKGIIKELTMELLGEPDQKITTKNSNNLRIRYLFKDIGLSKNVYEIIFTEDML